MHHDASVAALSVALALAAGMAAQSVARHLRLPGIVLLLGVGVLLGPDGVHIVDPDSLGSALQIIIGFAVAVILFEGGMNLDVKRLRRERGVIQRLLTIGALITALGAGFASWWFLDWDWRLATAFGVLMIVTGPTVITPLLRRIKVNHNLETVLEAEGVLIDAIGAVLAVVVLELLSGPISGAWAGGPVAAAARLGSGLVIGVAGGLVMALLLRFRRVVPDGLENVFTLTTVWALFFGSNAWMPESGVMTVTVAGLVVGNMRIRQQRHLLEFKEQLTVMFIGMLFVLLAADVRLAEISALGWAGAATVASLMFVVRPLNVAASTVRSGLSWKEKAFLSWLAPRGVVAAAVASLFAQTFESIGVPGGKQLQALVFTVIAATVVIQGLSGGWVAGWLGLRRPAHLGYMILGASELGREIGQALRAHGKDVAYLDSNPDACRAVEEAGFKVIYGNVMEELTLQRAQLEARACCIAVTTNQEVNLLFARNATEEFKVPYIYTAVRRDQSSVTLAVVRKAGAEMVFGVPRDLDLWSMRVRRGLAHRERWMREALEAGNGGPKDGEALADVPELLFLPLVTRRGRDVYPFSSGHEARNGDEVDLLVSDEHRDEAANWLLARGWRPMPAVEDPAAA